MSRAPLPPRPRLAAWRPPAGWRRVQVLDCHTGGEPFRIVLSGVAEIPGDTMLAKRRWAEEHLDGLRRSLMWEPRGHADMYGGLLTEAVSPSCDVGVLFLHNEGFSTMCGHGIIALATALAETGALPEGVEEIGIDSPAGPIRARLVREGARLTGVAFTNVPSFVAALDAEVEVPDLALPAARPVSYDLAFGGAFYAYVEAAPLGLELVPARAAELVAAGRAIKAAVSAIHPPRHPAEKDLSFLYGVIFLGPAETPGVDQRSVCVFADGELDRSPTGTGVSGLLAIRHARGTIGVGEPMVVESIVGSRFGGRVLSKTVCGPFPAIVPEISGRAHLCGRGELFLDPTDPFAGGFFLR